MVIVKPQRWQLCIVPASTSFACIATWQIGHGFGGLGFGD
jgi:hypothetical protein